MELASSSSSLDPRVDGIRVSSRNLKDSFMVACLNKSSVAESAEVGKGKKMVGKNIQQRNLGRKFPLYALRFWREAILRESGAMVLPWHLNLSQNSSTRALTTAPLAGLLS